MKSPFPYQNLSLINIAGEKWKSIPGFEGIYEISNFGRVKSLPRQVEMNSPAGGSYISKELIRRAKLEIKVNKTTGQNIYSLAISLYHDGISYNYSLPRLVHCVFIKKFDLSNKTILISYKDHDGRNVRVRLRVASSHRHLIYINLYGKFMILSAVPNPKNYLL